MRRAANQIKPIILAGSVAGFLVLASITYFLFARAGDPYRDLEKLDVISYVSSAKTFQGGTYQVEGNVEEVISITTGKGKMVSMAISSPQGAVLIPVLIPDNLRKFNLEKGQKIRIKAKGIHQGLLLVEAIDKSR